MITNCVSIPYPCFRVLFCLVLMDWVRQFLFVSDMSASLGRADRELYGYENELE